MNETDKKFLECSSDALCEILHSIALEEAALSHILSAEGEKIHKAVAAKDVCIQDLLCINNSVAKTIREVTGLELVLLNKLEAACSCTWKPTPPAPKDGWICIQVCDCKTKEGLKGAEIKIFENNKLVAKGCTDCQGKFKSELLAFGCYCVKILYEGQEKCLNDVKIDKHCCNDLSVCFDTNPCHNILFPKTISIRGQVTDQCGRPLAKVRIIAKGLDEAIVYTNQFGCYEICQLSVYNSFYIIPESNCFCGIGKAFNCIKKSCYTIDFKMHCCNNDCTK